MSPTTLFSRLQTPLSTMEREEEGMRGGGSTCVRRRLIKRGGETMEWNGGRWIVGWCSGGFQKVLRSTTKSPPDTQKNLPNVGIFFLLMTTRRKLQ